MKKKLTIISIVLIALIALCACSGDIETRDMTAEDSKVLSAMMYAGYKMEEDSEAIENGVITYKEDETGYTYTVNEDYSVTPEGYLVDLGINSIVLKKGAVEKATETETESSLSFKGTIVLNNDVSYAVEIEQIDTIDENGNPNEGPISAIINNVRINIPENGAL